MMLKCSIVAVYPDQVKLQVYLKYAFWQQLQIYGSPYLRIIGVKVKSDIRTMTHTYIANLDSADLRVSHSLANYLTLLFLFSSKIFFLTIVT